MKQFCLLSFLVLMVSSSYAQFVNNGATVIIQNGATLKVETNFINNTGGTITNNGTVDVTGDFTNNATFNSAANSLVKFSGNTVSNVTSGTAVFENVSLEKTNQNVVLVDAMSINDELNFVNNNNKVVLGNNNLTFGDNASVVNAGGNKYVATNGTGRFVKPISANGSLTFEVGDDAAIGASKYSPLTTDVSGTYGANANLAVKVNGVVHPEKPGDANDYITRFWDVTASDITTYAATLTGTYLPADVVGDQESIDGASYDGVDWSYENASGVGNTVSVDVTDVDVAFTGFIGKINLNLTAYIEGYMDGSSMRPVLMNSGLPNPATDCDNITVELRNSTAPYALAHTFTGVISTTGNLACNFPAAASGVLYYVVLKHRNALETWSANPVLFSSNTTYNFSTAASQAFGDNMVQVGSIYALYSGDIDADPADGVIDFFDYNVWEADYLDFAFGYFSSDLNGDGSVDFFDYNIWEANYLNFVGKITP